MNVLLGPVVYKFVFPYIWEYLQNNLINIASANLGAVCYELNPNNKQVKDVTGLLLQKTTLASQPKPYLWKVNSKHIPNVQLLIEFPLICNLHKIVLESVKFVPQKVLIEFSVEGGDDRFRKLVIVENMQKCKPLVVQLQDPIKAKFIRVTVLKGRRKHGGVSGSASLSRIACYGSPSFTTENLQHLNMDSILSFLQKAKNNFSRLAQQNQSTTHTQPTQPTYETATPPEQKSNVEEENIGEVKIEDPNEEKKHTEKASTASGSKNASYFFLRSKL